MKCIQWEMIYCRAVIHSFHRWALQFPRSLHVSKGNGSSGKQAAKAVIPMWCVNICNCCWSIGTASQRQKRAALFWFGCFGWELKWVTLTVWLDDWMNPCLKHYGNNVKMRLTQTCILTKAWFLSVLYIENRHLDFHNSDTHLQHPSLLCDKIVFCNCNFHPLRCHINSIFPSPSMYLQKKKHLLN